MLAKILFAVCAIFVLAHATDIYIAGYGETDTTCAGIVVLAMKYTLDQCTTSSTSSKTKISLSGSTYTYDIYGTTDTTCAIPLITVSSAADTRVTIAANTQYGVFLPNATGYVSGAASSADCTSGTCTVVSGNSACKCSSVPLSMRIDSCFSFSSRLHRNHVRLPWSCGSLDRVRLDSRLPAASTTTFAAENISWISYT